MDEDIAKRRRERLREWIAQHHGGKQAAFVTQTGMNQGEVSALLKDKAFGEKRARAIEAIAGMPKMYLDGLHAQGANAVGVPAERYITIPTLANKIGLGRQLLSEFDEVDGRHAFRRDWIIKHGWSVSDLRVVDVVGDSQSPYINSGDVVLINTAQKKIVDGEFYALRIGDEATIKRCYRQADGRIRLESLNAPTDYLTPSHSAEVQGKVVYRAG